MDKSVIVVVIFVAVVVFGGWYLVSGSTPTPTRSQHPPAGPKRPAMNPATTTGNAGSPAPGSGGGLTAALPPITGGMNNPGAIRLNLHYSPQSFGALAAQVLSDTGLQMVRDMSLPEPQNISVSLTDAGTRDLYDAISKQIGVPWWPYGVGGAVFTKENLSDSMR